MDRIILVAPDELAPEVLASRLRMQGYQVETATDPEDAAVKALAAPPAAIIADLWMQGISGVQLCRLLKAEPATASVPVILRGRDGQRNRFWAERAGAAGYAVQGRIGDLVRTLRASISTNRDEAPFFMQIDATELDVRDRIAAHLDAALFDSVIASEVRALGTCGDFTRLFDLFSQFVAQVTSYRWLAVSTNAPARFGLHCHPQCRAVAEESARVELEAGAHAQVMAVEDEDARDDPDGPAPIVVDIRFGSETIGKVALAACAPAHDNDRALVQVVARELAGPLRIVTLLEESQRQATTDPLTGLMNRRACINGIKREVARSERERRPVSVMLFDVDHFKHVNDRFGHAIGDAVLAEIGTIALAEARTVDLVARWGGEEFVVVLWDADQKGGLIAAERLRAAVSRASIRDASDEPVPITASFGVAERLPGESIDAWVDRADRAMYTAKSTGRNRCVGAAGPELRAISLASG